MVFPFAYNENMLTTPVRRFDIKDKEKLSHTIESSARFLIIVFATLI